MSSSPTDSSGLAARFFMGLVKRLWALALMALILWLSWRAINYLLVSLVFTTPPPPVIVDLPLRPDATMLQTSPQAFKGLTGVEHPRAPLAHYHRVETWFQADAHNDCTRSGCHAPLPHGENKADRAFLNMHATSLHCGVCHMTGESEPLRLAWYDLDNGELQPPPALLRAYGLLTNSGEQGPPQRELVTLLDHAIADAGGAPPLVSLRKHLAAVRAGSEEWRRLLDLARSEIPRHFRGEYGAKLALLDAEGVPRLGHPGNEGAVREFMESRDGFTGEQREEVLQRVHPARRSPTLQCQACHRPTGSLIDLGALGYPPARIQQLAQPLVTQMIDHIVAGQEFRMPGFLAPGGSPETRPAQEER